MWRGCDHSTNGGRSRAMHHRLTANAHAYGKLRRNWKILDTFFLVSHKTKPTILVTLRDVCAQDLSHAFGNLERIRYQITNLLKTPDAKAMGQSESGKGVRIVSL